MKSSQNNQIKTTRARKVIPIVICALLAVVLIFGAVLGIAALIREANAAVSYGGVTIAPGVAAYLVSTYKATYISTLRASGVFVTDAPFFWDKTAEGTDVTYGELLRRECEKYVRSVAICAYLYDRYASVDATAREWIDKNVKEVLDYKADGSVSKFNEMSADMGFNYNDFRAATELLYKAERARVAIYGEGGESLAYSGNIAECEKYLATYSRVRIIYIRLNDKFELDEHGNRVNQDGVDKKVALTDEERAVRASDIAAIKASIEALRNNTDGQMSPEYFNSFYYNSDGSYRYNDDPNNAIGGYYFAKNSTYTKEFAEYYPEAVEAALGMSVGDFEVVQSRDADGVAESILVLYKCEPETHAFASSANSHFFEDFYADASTYLFEKQLDSLIGEVNVKDAYRAIDPAALKKNVEFLIR